MAAHNSGWFRFAAAIEAFCSWDKEESDGTRLVKIGRDGHREPGSRHRRT